MVGADELVAAIQVRCLDQLQEEKHGTGSSASVTDACPWRLHQAGNLNFDRCIATPEVMPLVSRVARVGTRGRRKERSECSDERRAWRWPFPPLL